ncbi:hypothetical protein FOC4_g10007877 [Fusarium odoratissimum]|uniref:BTB domain-containing protein n=1 Tax=Fusarium oxysporum f. sp. cubense (strain race 4) TaxID=2502994 RepID=N1RNV1_FUSC4|nr:hypothetical protein FOC4_g10007877 [Fusarium odoratissimum]
MAASMSASWWSGANHLVAIEFQGRKTFHVELTKLEKYPQLYMQITSPAPSYIYGHVHNGMGFSYHQDLGPLYLDLHTVPQGAGHMLWDYLSAGTFTPLQGNPSDKKQEEYFKSIVHVYAVADEFSIEGLKSDTAKEIFRKAQEMGLIELVKLLEEANYRSDSFPKLSEYLEKRLHSMLVEVDRRRVAGRMAASEVIGWKESKYPRTMWVKPKSETAGASKLVGSRFFGPAAKGEDRSGIKDYLGRPMQRTAVPEPTFYSPSEPAFIPPSMFLPSLAHGTGSNEAVLLPAFGDTPRTLRYEDFSSTSRRAKTLSEIDREWQMEVIRQEQKLRQPSHLVRQRMAKMGFEEPESQMEHDAPSKSPLPSSSTTSGGFSSETATDTEKDILDEATKPCDRPVTPIGSELNLPEYMVPSFDAPLQSFTSSPDTLEGDPVEVEGPMNWDTGLSEYEYIPSDVS